MSVKATLIAGASAGAFADTLTHPMCTIKARLMSQGAATSVEGGAEQVIYKGLFDGFKRIVAAEGPLAVYKGLGIVLIGAAPAQALFFAGMTAVQKVFSPKSDLANFGARMVAQTCGGLFWVPMEVVKEKMMIQGQIATKETYSGSFDLTRRVIAKEGIRGIYRGFVLQQLTYGPFNGLALVFYNRFKYMLPEDYQQSVVGHGVASTFGCKFVFYF